MNMISKDEALHRLVYEKPNQPVGGIKIAHI